MMVCIFSVLRILHCINFHQSIYNSDSDFSMFHHRTWLSILPISSEMHLIYSCRQVTRHRPYGFIIRFGKINDHTSRICIAGCQQIVRLLCCQFKHFSKVFGLHIPVILEMLNNFPFELLIPPMLRKVRLVLFQDRT